MERHGQPAVTYAEFELALPTQELLRHYRGEAHALVVRSSDGRTLQLPVSALRRFVTCAGLWGRFAVEYDAARRLHSVRRL